MEEYDIEATIGNDRVSRKTRCQVKDCNNLSQKDGKCRRHGGRYFCQAEECNKHALIGGKCNGHGGGVVVPLKDVPI